MNWDEYFLEMAWVVCKKSKDPSTKTGAVIVAPNKSVISVGYNGFPHNMPDNPEWYDNRVEKYSRIVHCEMNALIFAGRPIPEGSTLYTVPFISCERCVVHMLQAGITHFVAPKSTEEQLTRWSEAFEKTRRYVRECGGTVIEL